MKIKVTVAQYDVPEDPKEANRKALEIALESSQKNAQILLLPETALGSLADVKQNSTDRLPELIEIAKRSKINIASSFYSAQENKYYNTGYLVSSDGKILISHKKIYLAKDEFESNIQNGNKLSYSDNAFGRVGMMICKDGFNRYSHFLYEKCQQYNTDVILIPSWSLGIYNINVEEYIKTFFTYGAFLSRSFVLVSGNLNKSTKSFGQAMIIDPIDGIVKIGSRDKEELLIHEIDIDKVKLARNFDKEWQPEKRVGN